MPVNVFLSYDFNDNQQAMSLRTLLADPNHPIEFHDRSPQAPVVGRRGKPLAFPPEDPSAAPVRREIIRKFNQSTRLIVLVGEYTYQSKWVKWEIVNFFEKKKRLQGPPASSRIAAMHLRGHSKATLPDALMTRCCLVLEWNPRELARWLASDLGD